MWRMTSPAAPDPPADRDGWVTLQVHCDDHEQAMFIVLGFGPRAEVVEPPSLQAEVRQAIAAAAARSQSSDPSDEVVAVTT
jgi:predicted DNA-binding transcriptional regulator YafY